MILQGVLDKSLGNFTCIRGYAQLGELFEISAPDPSYQRDLITKQQHRMEKFLDDGEYLFFPEVILGASLGNESNIGVVSDFNLSFNDDKSAKFEFPQFKLNYSVTKRKSLGDSRTSILYRRASLDINENFLKSENFKKFHRIDGNHRLSILNDDLDTPLTEGKVQRYSRLNVPFCLVLFNDDLGMQKFSRALFHNLNYKQIALTMEQSLKQILEDNSLFPDNALDEKFGPEYLLARKVLNTWDLSMIPNIESVICSVIPAKVNKRTFLLKTFQHLQKHGYLTADEDSLEQNVADFKGKLSAINTIYEHSKLGGQSNSGLLSAFFYYAYQSPAILRIFNNWVLENHIYQTQDIEAEELIKIFNCVLEAKKRTVFVSLQNGDESEENYTAIEDGIRELNVEFNLDIQVRPLRIDRLNKGHSFNINQQLLDLIEHSGLLIADLTFGNKNVYHELGYLMGLNKGKDKEHKNFILLHNKSLSKADEDISFNIQDMQQIRASNTNEIRHKIKEHVSRYYSLN
jgi:hypothetical protein